MIRPRFWRLWGHGLRGLAERLRRQDALYQWHPARLRMKPWRGAFAWWRRSLLNQHGWQTGTSAGRRVFGQTYHLGPLLLVLGRRRP